jgi:hypothetical protein
MKSIIGLLVVALIVGVAYKVWFSQLKSEGAGTPVQTIDVVGVKTDLLGIAQAERGYQAEHGNYISLDELISSGALTMTKPGRDGYTYEVQTTDGGFRAVAHCPATTSAGCTNWSVNQDMDVEQAP